MNHLTQPKTTHKNQQTNQQNFQFHQVTGLGNLHGHLRGISADEAQLLRPLGQGLRQLRWGHERGLGASHQPEKIS